MGRYICVVIALLVLGACGSQPADQRPFLLTSVPAHAWLCQAIGGEHIRVQQMLPPGASPHQWQPDDASIATAAQASAYLQAGLEFEEGSWFDALTSGKLVLEMNDGIDLRRIECHAGDHDHGHDHGAHGNDPHTWLDPTVLLQQAHAIQRLLIHLDAAHSTDYRKNLMQLAGELELLHRDLMQQLLLLQGRSILVYHPSWGYLCDRYGLKQVPVELAGQDPSDADLAALSERAGNEDFAAVFVQPQIASKAAERLAEHLGVPLVVIDPLFADPLVGLRAVANQLNESLQQ